MASTIRYQSFPRTNPPPPFVEKVMAVFRSHESGISTILLNKGLTSDEILQELRSDLKGIGFQVEEGKASGGKISRPVLFGENGKPAVNYDIDGYNEEHQAVLEIEAGRAWMGNAVYRDLIRSCSMVHAKYLLLAVPNLYRYKSGGKAITSTDYQNTFDMLDTLYQQVKFRLPFETVLIGY